VKVNKGSNLKKQTIDGFIWMLSGSGIQSIMQFLVLIVLARLLDPESFGVVSVALVVISFTVILSTLGFGPALVQKKEITNAHIGTSYIISFILAVFFGIIVFLISPFIADFFHAKELALILKVMTIVFVLQGMSIVSESLIQREMLFALIVRIQVISYFTYGVVGVVLALFGFGVWALVIAYITQMFIKSALSLYLQPFKITLEFNYSSFKELLYFSGGYSLAKISSEVSLQGDSFIIGRYLGSEALGLYSRAYQLMVMPANLVGKVIENVLFPAMSKIQDDNKKLSYVYREGICLTTTLILPSSVFLILNAKSIILLLFGIQWLDLVEPFKVLALALLFRSSYKISDTLAKAKGAIYHRAFRKWLYAIFVLAGSYIGQFHGLVGVSIGVSIAILLNYAIMTQLVVKLTDIKVREIIVSHIGGIIIATVFWLVSIPFEKYVMIYFSSLLLELVVYILFFLLIYLTCILIKPRLFLGINGEIFIIKIKSELKRLTKNI